MEKTIAGQKESGVVTAAPRGSGDRREPVYVYTRWCKGCGICIAFCPRGVLEMGREDHPAVVHPERCTSCRLCESLCPDFGITVTPRRTGQKE